MPEFRLTLNQHDELRHKRDVADDEVNNDPIDVDKVTALNIACKSIEPCGADFNGQPVMFKMTIEQNWVAAWVACELENAANIISGNWAWNTSIADQARERMIGKHMSNKAAEIARAFDLPEPDGIAALGI